MGNHRLRRLAQLTQGAALIGLGFSAAACAKDPPVVNAPIEDKPHINAPPTPMPSASAAPAASQTTVDPPSVNSPPPQKPKPMPTASTSFDPTKAPLPKYTNSPDPGKG